MVKKSAFILFIFLNTLSCKNSSKAPEKLSSKQIDSLLKLCNKKLVYRDTTMVDSYVKRVYNSDSTNVKVLCDIALIKLGFLEPFDAIFYLDKGLKLTPNNSTVYYIKGLAWSLALNDDSALFYHSKAIEFKPDTVIYLETRSRIYHALKKDGLALDDINKAISLDASNTELLAYKGNYLEGLGKYEDALICYEKALKDFPKDVKIIGHIGYILVKLENYKEARSAFDKAIELDSTYGAYYCGRGIAKFQLGEKDFACQDFKKAASLGDKEGAEYYQQCLEHYNKNRKS